MADDTRLEELVNRLVEKSRDFGNKDDAKAWVVVELLRELPDISRDDAKRLAEQIVDISQKNRKTREREIEKITDARRKEVGRYWPVTTPEGSVAFEKGMRALQQIGIAFYTEDDWKRLGLKERYKFLDKIEKILKNPVKYQKSEDYETIKIALIEAKESKDEPIDKLEEAALMALGVLKRRRGSENQIARMGEDRRDQRREARNIETYWTEGTRRPRPRNPTPTPTPTLWPTHVPTHTPTLTPTHMPTATPTPTLTPSRKIRVIVDSQPMQDVFVEVKRKKELTPGDLKIELEKYLPKDFHILIPDIINAIKRYEKKNIKEEADKVPYLKSDLSLVLSASIAATHLTALPDLYSLARYIIEDIIGDWQKIDKWEFSFKLYRNQRYYQTKSQDYNYTMRNQMSGRNFAGQDINANRTGLADPMKRSSYTIFYLEIPEGDYQFTADPTTSSIDASVSPSGTSVPFDHWEIEGVSADRIYDIKQYHKDNTPPGINERLVRSVQRGIITHYDNKLEIHIDKPITLTAVYRKGFDEGYKSSMKAREDAAKQDGSYRYQRGATAGGGDLRKGSLLGRTGIRSRLGRTVEPRKDLGKDPYLLAAINKGKRILNGYAKAEYSRLFDPFNARYKERMTELRKLKKDAVKARRSAIKFALTNRKEALRGVSAALGGASPQDLMNMLARMIKSAAGDPVATEAFKNARDALEIYMNSRDKYFEDFRVEVESKTAQMKSFMESKAVTVATGLAQRYRMPAGSGSEASLKDALIAYSNTMTEDFIVRGRTWRHALMRGMGIASRSTETFSATGMNALQSTVDFILGPWTWTTIFALVQFFFVFNFVGYNVVYLWVFPLIAGGFALLLNFSETVKPLDWLTHFMSGAIIGYAAMLFMVSLGANNWTFMTPVWFWIIWAILGFLGVMQFYQTGGWKIALQGGVILLLFAYIALGPYSAYYQQALDQVKAPVEVAFRAVEKAFTDVWLLATDPTEFYARQQVVNVKPESPIDFAKGLEVSLFDILPAAVPAGQEFAATFVIRNEGRLSTPMTDISIGFACKQYCDIPPAPIISQPRYSLCQETTVYGFLTSGQIVQYYCADKCATGSATIQANVNVTGESCVQACKTYDSGAGSQFNNPYSNAIIGAATKCLTPDAQKLSKNYAYLPSLEKGESVSVSVRGFKATSSERRSGETRLAKVALNITYRYATSSSLLTEIISESEMNRKINDKEQVFRNVPSTTKSTPGRLSLNVGPQPLMAGREALLLVSVSSTRDDGEVRLDGGSKIIITLPKSIGIGLSCGNTGKILDPADANKEVLEYTVPSDVTILSSEFQSIYAFICSFTTTSDVIETKSELITAELPEYKFALRKEKDLVVTPSIGITYEPSEKECQIATEEQACYERKAQKTCWYEHTDVGTETLREYVPFTESSCHSCGIVKSCGYFLPKDCKSPGDDTYGSSGAGRCGLSCAWDENAGQSGEIRENPIMSGSHLSLKGLCVNITAAGCDIVAVSLDTIRTRESGGNYNAPPNSASASGAYQFITSTWQSLAAASGCNAQQYTIAVDAPPATQDCVAAYYVRDILSKNNNDPGSIPISWYYPVALTDPTWMDRIPHPEYGNTLTVRQYQTAWLSTYNSKMTTCLRTNTTSATSTGWSINGIASQNPVFIGDVFNNLYYAKINSVSGSEFNIALKIKTGSTYDDVDCYSYYGTGARLKAGETVECESPLFNTIFNSGLNIGGVIGDDMQLKLENVDTTNKNIQISVGPNPFYGGGRTPLSEWTLCANSVCAKKGNQVQITGKDLLMRFSLVGFDEGANATTLVGYTVSVLGWGEADCSNWPLKSSVTLKSGESAQCQSTGLTQFIFNDIFISVDNIDKTNKIVRIRVQEI